MSFEKSHSRKERRNRQGTGDDAVYLMSPSAASDDDGGSGDGDGSERGDSDRRSLHELENLQKDAWSYLGKDRTTPGLVNKWRRYHSELWCSRRLNHGGAIFLGTLHGVLFLLHFALAITVVTAPFFTGLQRSISLTRLVLIPWPPVPTNSTAPVVALVPWIANARPGGWMSPISLMFIFELVTAFAHLYYAVDGGMNGVNSGYGLQTLVLGINPSRWVEYSISAPIMIALLGIVAGERDTGLLVLQIMSMALTTLVGGLLVEYQQELPALRSEGAPVLLEGQLSQSLLGPRGFPANSAELDETGLQVKQGPKPANPIPLWKPQRTYRKIQALRRLQLAAEADHRVSTRSRVRLWIVPELVSWVTCIMAWIPIFLAVSPTVYQLQHGRSPDAAVAVKYIRLTTGLEFVIFLGFGIITATVRSLRVKALNRLDELNPTGDDGRAKSLLVSFFKLNLVFELTQALWSAVAKVLLIFLAAQSLDPQPYLAAVPPLLSPQWHG